MKELFSVSNLSIIVTILGILVGLTNILTQVIKNLTWDKIPSQLLAFIVSEGLTLIAFFAYCAITNIAILWYYVVGAVILGFMVSYGAMYGYDKLIEIVQGWFKTKEDKTDGT